MEDSKIGGFESGFMIAIALLFDAAQVLINLLSLALPFAGQAFSLGFGFVTTTLAYIIFFVWFFFHGKLFLNPRKPLSFLGKFGAGIAEVIPFISALPLVTTVVVLTLMGTQKGGGLNMLSRFTKLPRITSQK